MLWWRNQHVELSQAEMTALPAHRRHLLRSGRPLQAAAWSGRASDPPLFDDLARWWGEVIGAVSKEGIAKLLV